jgi:hypothetical protein
MNARETVGTIGEHFVREFYNHNFILSDDKFDNVKDGTLGHLTGEVKSMTKIFQYGEYWLETNQFRKVTDVDLLFIVDVPLWAKHGCDIYLCTNNSQLKIESRVREGKRQPTVIIPEKKLLKLTTIKNDDRIQTMINMSDSLSAWRRKKKAGEMIYA